MIVSISNKFCESFDRLMGAYVIFYNSLSDMSGVVDNADHYYVNFGDSRRNYGRTDATTDATIRKDRIDPRFPVKLVIPFYDPVNYRGVYLYNGNRLLAIFEYLYYRSTSPSLYNVFFVPEGYSCIATIDEESSEYFGLDIEDHTDYSNLWRLSTSAPANNILQDDSTSTYLYTTDTVVQYVGRQLLEIPTTYFATEIAGYSIYTRAKNTDIYAKNTLTTSIRLSSAKYSNVISTPVEDSTSIKPRGSFVVDNISLEQNDIITITVGTL